MSPDLELSLHLADLADSLTMQRFGAADLRIDTKSDSSPVTDADVRVEEMLREALKRERPGHGVAGEELGDTGDGEWRWYVDPIDGTKNYVRGVPVWATLIALRHEAEPVCAVVSAPALHRRWWAEQRGGTHTSHRAAVHVSQVRALDSAHLSCTDPRDFAVRGHAAGYLELSARCRQVRAFGDFWSHMLVAEGAIDIGIEPVVAPWDIAAVQLIVEEAGGRFSDFQGRRRIDSGNVLTTNSLLHDEVTAMLAAADGARP
ncbi:MAG: histidinol-phosphatase [Chloroflexi bacterium]|nr:MAG: histidinol-phosphatase [Chloroflexota bacterium]